MIELRITNETEGNADTVALKADNLEEFMSVFSKFYENNTEKKEEVMEKIVEILTKQEPAEDKYFKEFKVKFPEGVKVIKIQTLPNVDWKKFLYGKNHD